MKKADLKDGMFGIMNGNKEDVFVIVNGHLVYQHGKCDPINETLFSYGISDDLSYEDNKITHLYEAMCFDQVKTGKAKLLWERDSEETLEESDGEETKDFSGSADELFELYTELRDSGFDREQANDIFKAAMLASLLDKLSGGMKK